MHLRVGSAQAYFVAPYDHVGKVVTGVVLLHDAFGAHTPYCFGFADSVADQGYKVIVPQLLAEDELATSLTEESTHVWKARMTDVEEKRKNIQEAVTFLLQTETVQTVAVLGLGWGAELALHYSFQESSPFTCVVAFCPTQLDPIRTAVRIPTLCLCGSQQAFVSEQQLRDLSAVDEQGDKVRLKLSPGQQHGFGYANITDEDAATQAIAEVLDFLVARLHKFKTALSTSDSIPWWPQGRNGPFFNVGLDHWQHNRDRWRVKTHEKPPRPARVSIDSIVEDLTSVRRTYELPGRMTLPDIVEVLVDIWDV